MKELKMTYKEGKGRISIDLDRFFPCTQRDFRKVLDIVDMSAEKESHIATLYGYLVGKIDFIKSIINGCVNSENEFYDCPDVPHIINDPNGHAKKYAGYADIICKRYDLKPVDTDFVVTLKKATFYTMLYVKSREEYDYVKKDGWIFSKFGYDFEVYKDEYRYVILVAGTGTQITESSKKKNIPFAITEKELAILEKKEELLTNLKKDYSKKMIELGEIEAPKKRTEGYFVESPDYYEPQGVKEPVAEPQQEEPKKNRIPRNAARLYITYLVGGNCGKIGDTAVVERDEYGNWIATDQNGKQWSMFVSHLRNGKIIQIDRIETKEDIERQRQSAAKHQEMVRRAYIVRILTKSPQPTRQAEPTNNLMLIKRTVRTTTRNGIPGLTGKQWISGNLDSIRVAEKWHDTS